MSSERGRGESALTQGLIHGFNPCPLFLTSKKRLEKTSPLGGLFPPKGEFVSKNVIYKPRIL